MGTNLTAGLLNEWCKTAAEFESEYRVSGYRSSEILQVVPECQARPETQICVCAMYAHTIYPCRTSQKQNAASLTPHIDCLTSSISISLRRSSTTASQMRLLASHIDESAAAAWPLVEVKSGIHGQPPSAHSSLSWQRGKGMPNRFSKLMPIVLLQCVA